MDLLRLFRKKTNKRQKVCVIIFFSLLRFLIFAQNNSFVEVIDFILRDLAPLSSRIRSAL